MAEELIINSPLPGVFYRRPDPNSDPFVDEGASVGTDDVVGLVEVMKSFHEVKSEVEGTIVRFLVENEDAVVIGQPLVAVKP